MDLLLLASKNHMFFEREFFFFKHGNQCGHTKVKSILLYLLVGLVIMKGQTQQLFSGTREGKGTDPTSLAFIWAHSPA